MKIATYNVRNLYDAETFIDEKATEPVKEEFFNKRISFFTEILRPLDLDIVCLQEIGGEKGVSLIGDALGYNYFFAKPNSRGIRMAVLYKKEMASHVACQSVSFGELPIPSIQEIGDTQMFKPISQRRDVLVVDLEDFHGKKLRIVTFHLKSNLPMYLGEYTEDVDAKTYTEAKFRCVFYKMMELSGLRAYTDKSLDEGREIILLGDFNENNNSSGLDILRGSNKEEKTLSDVLSDYKGDTTTHIHRGNRLTFDTMLVSQGLKPLIKEVAILNKDLEDCSMLPLNADVVGTDHAMVIVTLE